MSGTTLCPHCDTRFRIAEAQLEAHHGMVRCGHCLQAFDAHPNFIPDQPDPQLELPMLDQQADSAEQPPVDGPQHMLGAPSLPEEQLSVAETAEETAPADATVAAEAAVAGQTGPSEIPHHDLLDFSQPLTAAPPSSEAAILLPMTLAEQVAVIKDSGLIESEAEPAKPKRRRWPWTIALLLLLLVLFAQAAYFFRVDLASRLPALKPVLVGYCQLLKCSVPLPHQADLMSIESSDLEADPAHENQIALNALLRNRAAYTQAFPTLELTLNDSQDKPLARRTFRPADYLPPAESEKTGLLPNHELNIKVRLDTTDLKASGYRLALLYPNN